MPNFLTKILSNNTASTSQDIVRNTPDSKYSMENIGGRKLVEKLHAPEGKVSRTTYQNGTEVTTISNKRKK